MTATRPRVLLTRRWPAGIEAEIAARYDLVVDAQDRPLDAGALRAALTEFDAVCPTVSDRLPAALFEGLTPRARILGNFGVGVSHIDLAAATAAGLVVTNTPGVLDDCTADLAITLMLMAARRAGEGERELRAGAWSGWRPTHLMGRKVSGGIFGVAGFGRIGRAAARRAHFGFGMQVLAVGRRPLDPAHLAETGASQARDLDDLLARADVVSLHMPGGAGNRHLIDARRLSLMKPTAILVNTARGEVVDEAALAAALAAGRLAAAGLDVYEREPVVHPDLLAAENAILLPHLGSATVETRVAMGRRVLANLDAVFAGHEPADRVTP